MLRILSCLCWPPVCFLWRNVSLGLLPIFESFYHEWMLNFVKCFFGICWDDRIAFVFPFVNVIHHTDWLVYIEQSLWPWSEYSLIFSSLYSLPPHFVIFMSYLFYISFILLLLIIVLIAFTELFGFIICVLAYLNDLLSFYIFAFPTVIFLSNRFCCFFI